MSIALYSFTDIPTSGTSVDASSGSNRMMVFVGFGNVGSDTITAVSWNGESFTKRGAIQLGGGGRFISLWTAVPVGTGSHTVTVTGAMVADSSGISVFTGVNTAISPKNYTETSGSGTTATITVTANNGDWITGGVINDGGNVSAGANTTKRSGADSLAEGDSNGVASPTAIAFTFASGNYAGSAVALVPTQALTLTMAQGAYALTGFALLFQRTYTMVASFGSYVLTGQALSFVNSLWTRLTKNTSVMTNTTKDTSNWTNTSKDSSSFTNQNKS